MFGLFADWSILYVTVIIFGIIMAIGGIVWAICFCMGRLVPHFYVKNYVKHLGRVCPRRQIKVVSLPRRLAPQIIRFRSLILHL